MAIMQHPASAPAAAADLAGAVDGLHAAVEDVFGEFDRADGGRAMEYRALLRISDAMAAHATVEQELLHPAVREQTGRHEDDFERHLEQQHLMDLILVELASMVPGERRFRTKIRLLRDLFRQHVAEQERTLLPELHRYLDAAERRRLAEDVGAYARQLRMAS